jgi:glucose-1-phosphate cytidylyltransferase
LKTLILAGGKGTRFMEESVHMPKPMIPILNKPMIIHIMEHYFKFGVTEFVILGGEKIDYIYDYFEENFEVIDISLQTYRLYNKFNVQILDTGKDTMTGGRVKKAVIELDLENFMVTYGDGFSDIDIDSLIKFHKKQKTIATLSGMRPPARFGSLEIKGDLVVNFGEKNQTKEGWINGGYFVMNKAIIEYIDNDDTILERKPLESLSKINQLSVYKHKGYFQPVDTIREKEILESKLKEQNN